jgi:V8-like Glu-specific endopeptidase
MMSSRSRTTAVLATGMALILISSAAVAGDFTKLNNPNPNDSESYWTPERFHDAQPLLRAEPNPDAFGPEENAGLAASVSVEGHAPAAGIRPDLESRLFDREDAAAEKALRSGGEKASGTAGAFFTSARLVPTTADQTYPYRAVGKLFFTKPGQGDFYCSAAVLRARVVLTAAQCIHSGKANPGFYSNFRFVPATRDGSAPFGTWNWNYVIVPTTWSTGGGTVPNAADYGMIEVQDQTIDGVLRKLGDVTGFFGYQTLKLRPNHAHLLGYASNFDGGQRMHQVTAQAFRAAAANNVEYGSDMRGGSAGGPLVQDFGDNPALAKIIGVLSYFNSSTGPKVEGASIPDSRFSSLLTTICAHRAGNC